MSEVLHPETTGPDGFTTDRLRWHPWLPPLPVEEFEERHWHGVVDPARAQNPYFALLARQPEILAARTQLDWDVFRNTEGGLPRAEREIAATVASVVNGCVYCASVHARTAIAESGREEDVHRLLDDGTDAELDERWDALVDLVVALTRSPVDVPADLVSRLAELGLDDVAIADAIASGAFFSWANRLMLSLGEPSAPARRG